MRNNTYIYNRSNEECPSTTSGRYTEIVRIFITVQSGIVGTTNENYLMDFMYFFLF